MQQLVENVHGGVAPALPEQLEQLEQKVAAGLERHPHGGGAQQKGVVSKGLEQKAGLRQRLRKLLRHCRQRAAGLHHNGGEQHLLLHAVLRLQAFIQDALPGRVLVHNPQLFFKLRHKIGAKELAHQAEGLERELLLERRVRSLRAGMTPDAVLVDLEAAMDALGEVTGRTMREDITNRIFERFCVGK
mgnify:CR=1 FL=1